jgi:hypothetical protein
MGLLDDAIRQHLELKRQHGAPDEEIQRAEQEALGPARRDSSLDTSGVGVPPLEEVPGEEIEEEPAGSVFDHPGPAEEEFAPPPPPPPVDDPVYADEYEVQPAPADYDEPTQIHPATELEPLEELEAEELEEAPPPGTPKPHGDPALGDYSEPVVHVEDEPEEDPESSREEDVLEETPEFLQDTPEHDKLWFEQKPPRDFDFD